MALAEENRRPGEFNFTWSIHNFSHCNKKTKEYLTSPSFYIADIEMQLLLYPKGYYSTGFMSLFFRVVNYEYFRDTKFDFVLSLKRCNGTFKDSREFSYSVSSQQSNECRKLVSVDELNKLNAYLEHDVLTLRCLVWERNYRFSEQSVECFAKTEIKIAKVNYRWILEDLVDSDGILKHKFKQSTVIPKFSSGFPHIQIHVSTGETYDDDTICLAIERHSTGASTLLFSVYNIHLLDSYGSVVHSVRGEALFQNSNETQKFLFLGKRKLISSNEFNLPRGKLTLQCELSFSGDLVEHCVEYGKNDEQVFCSKKTNEDSVSDGHELWKKNLQQFYFDGHFADLLVRTPDREFPVHRAILLAQSKVFRGMLSHDMKEKNSSVIEINDFEDDTVSKLLLYLYTNALDDNIDFALAKDLYFAADKYQITPLQKVCSNRLIESTDASNVCDILLLADQLRDDELKSTARNLIASSPYEIMNSDGWKNLMDTNSHLTSETMQWMLFTNFLSHKK